MEANMKLTVKQLRQLDPQAGYGARCWTDKEKKMNKNGMKEDKDLQNALAFAVANAAAMKNAAKKQYNRLLRQIANCQGQVHATLRDDVVDYGRLAGLPLRRIARDLLKAGVNQLDMEGALKGAMG